MAHEGRTGSLLSPEILGAAGVTIGALGLLVSIKLVSQLGGLKKSLDDFLKEAQRSRELQELKAERSGEA